MNGSFPQFLFILAQVSYFLVVIAGLLLALMWWRRMPMVALWAALGFGCLLASGVASYAALPTLQLLTRLLGLGNASSPHTYALIMSISKGLLSTAGLAMLIVAIFGWRQSVVPPR